MLEWAAFPFSRGSSWPRDRTSVSCIGGWILDHWAPLVVTQNQIRGPRKLLGGARVHPVSASGRQACETLTGTLTSPILPTGLSQFRLPFWETERRGSGRQCPRPSTSALQAQRAAVKQEWSPGISTSSLTPLTTSVDALACHRCGKGLPARWVGRGKTWDTAPHPTTRRTPHFRESSGTQTSVVRRLRNPDLEITSVCLTLSHLSMSLWLYHPSIFTYLSAIYLCVYWLISSIYHLSIYYSPIYHLSVC